MDAVSHDDETRTERFEVTLRARLRAAELELGKHRWHVRRNRLVLTWLEWTAFGLLVVNYAALTLLVLRLRGWVGAFPW